MALPMVKVLRVVLPTIALALIALVVMWPQIVSRTDQFRIGYAELQVNNDDLSMINPRYVGTDKHDRPFSVIAQSVRNIVPEGGAMVLDAPDAEMTLADGAWVMVSAGTGTYDVHSQILVLSDVVKVFHDKGYAFKSDRARVDLDKGVVTSTSAVLGHGPGGVIEGTGLTIDNDGTSILVHGPATLTIRR